MKPKHPLEKKDFGVLGFTNYRGVVVWKIIGGYRIMENKVTTPEEVDKAIDEAAKSLDKSIME